MKYRLVDNGWKAFLSEKEQTRLAGIERHLKQLQVSAIQLQQARRRMMHRATCRRKRKEHETQTG